MITSIGSRIPYSVYAATQGDSITRVKVIDQSPLHYQHRLHHPRTSQPMTLGTAAHCAVLEPERYAKDFAVWDERTESGNLRPRRSKDWDAFAAAHASQTILTGDEHAAAVAIATAVRSHGPAMRYLETGDPEVSMLWPTKGNGGERQSKGRVDWLTTVDGLDVLVGLKTCRDVSPRVFGSQAARLGYAMQWAYYFDGYAAITGRQAKLIEIVVESAAPYAVGVYLIPADVVEFGRGAYLEALAKVAACESAAHWPGPIEGEVELRLPAWAFRVEDEEYDVESLGLVA